MTAASTGSNSAVLEFCLCHPYAIHLNCVISEFAGKASQSLKWYCMLRVFTRHNGALIQLQHLRATAEVSFENNYTDQNCQKKKSKRFYNDALIHK